MFAIFKICQRKKMKRKLQMFKMVEITKKMLLVIKRWNSVQNHLVEVKK